MPAEVSTGTHGQALHKDVHGAVLLMGAQTEQRHRDSKAEHVLEKTHAVFRALRVWEGRDIQGRGQEK